MVAVRYEAASGGWWLHHACAPASWRQSLMMTRVNKFVRAVLYSFFTAFRSVSCRVSRACSPGFLRFLIGTANPLSHAYGGQGGGAVLNIGCVTIITFRGKQQVLHPAGGTVHPQVKCRM